MNKKLNDLLKNSGLTKQRVSQISEVPYSTVCRFFTADQDFQQAQNLADIIRAMGGSVDEFFGLKKEDEQPHPQQSELIELYRDMLAERERFISEKESELAEHHADLAKLQGELLETRKACKRLFWLFAISVAAIIGILIVDLLNGGFGYIRY